MGRKGGSERAEQLEGGRRRDRERGEEERAEKPER